MRRRRVRAAALWSAPLLLALSLGVWHPGRTTDLAAGIEGRLLDLRFAVRGPVDPPRAVAVVLIDDADTARMGGFPPSRRALARAVDAIAARAPASIALDLLLIDGAADDPTLARALARAPGAVAAIARAGPEATTSPALAEAVRRSGFDVVAGGAPDLATGARGPNGTLAPAVRLGHANVPPGEDGAVRRIPVSVALTAGDDVAQLPGLALAALRAADPDARLVLRGATARRDGAVGFGDAVVPLDHGGAITLVPYCPRGTIDTWPLRDGGGAALAGRVVFAGLTGMGVGDLHPTAFDAALPGVELQATLAANVLEGHHLRRDRTAWLIDLLVGLAAAVTGMPAATRLHPAACVGAVVLGVPRFSAGSSRRPSRQAGGSTRSPSASPTPRRRPSASCCASDGSTAAR